MKFYLETISYSSLKYLENSYNPTRTLAIEEIVEKKNYNIMMIDIALALNYAKFDEVKGCATSHEMWTKLIRVTTVASLKDIYGGDDNIKRAKVESLRV